MSYMIIAVGLFASIIFVFSIYTIWYINHNFTTCNIYQRKNMEMPHDDIFAQIENWCTKNRFLQLCMLALRMICVAESTAKKTGIHRLFNNSKLSVVEGIRLRNMPRGTAGKIDTFKYVIRRNRNKLYLDPDAKLQERQRGHHAVIVGKLRNGKFVVSCMEDNLPIFKNTWFAHGFRITKIKFGKFIRIERAKKERLDRIAAKKRKKQSAQIAENVRKNAQDFQRQERRRQNQYTPGPGTNQFNSIKKYW